MADDRYVVDSGEYVRDAPLPSTPLFKGVDADAMLDLTRATIEARRPEMPDCTCGAPEDAEPEDHDLDCPEHPTGEDPDRDEEI